MVYSATRLRANLYQVLREVLDTGVPVEVELNGRRLKIVPEHPGGKLDKLEPHPEALACDPDLIVSLDWSDDLNNRLI
jgi:hypothetical protein